MSEVHPKLCAVAAAIMQAREGNACRVVDWYREEQDNPHVAKALRQARAAVRALMEPDEGMVEAGNMVPDRVLHADGARRPADYAGNVLRAMLQPLVEGEGK